MDEVEQNHIIEEIDDEFIENDIVRSPIKLDA